jgi:hypothetical protein
MGKYTIQFPSIILVSFMLILAITVSTLAQDKKGDDAIKSLTSRIEALEKQVKEQGAKIAELKSKLNEIQNPMVLVPKSRGLHDFPKGGNQFQFNGQTYYMMPIKDTVNVK